VSSINLTQNQHLQYFTTTTSSSINQQQRRNYSSLSIGGNIHKNVPPLSSGMDNQRRRIATHEITKNIQLFSENPINVDRDPVTLKLKTPTNKPIVLMFAWLLAKQKHIAKYAKIYIDQGYDVLVVTLTPWQLMWPVKGTQIIAKDAVTFMLNNSNYSPVLLHGFSVGAYQFGECMVHMAREIDKYQPLLDRIQGQVWDSVADITEIPIGVPKAIFPNNKTLQSALKTYMLYHLNTFHDPATSHYIRSSQMFHSTLVKAPAQFFLSKSDLVGAWSSNNRVRENWVSLGIKVNWKCWDRSPHVGHYHKHTADYMGTLYEYLSSVNMINHPEKIRISAKL
jgi:hypothetical protein